MCAMNRAWRQAEELTRWPDEICPELGVHLGGAAALRADYERPWERRTYPLWQGFTRGLLLEAQRAASLDANRYRRA